MNTNSNTPNWRVTTNYGGVTISRDVYAASEEEAMTYTGIATELEALGYTVELDGDAEYEAVPLDVASSASRQHYIDTGRYLTEEDSVDDDYDPATDPQMGSTVGPTGAVHPVDERIDRSDPVQAAAEDRYNALKGEGR